MQITENLQELYRDQYLNPEIAQWRMIGAKQKAKNIIDIVQAVKQKDNRKKYQIERVLEVGAGDGAILAELSKQNFAKEYHAVEISESGINAINQRNLPQLKSVLPFDGYKLPFEDDSFDLVILSHVLEHVEHERVLLREIQRVAQYCIVEVPREYRYGVHLRLQHFLDYGHINMYTPSSLAFLLGTEKFYIEKMLCRLYNQETYTFPAKSFIQKTKFSLVYWAKYLLSHTPFASFNQKYINTITVFCDKNSFLTPKGEINSFYSVSIDKSLD